jgi:4-hydroxy-2-oxoheptanedioate aldolase
VALIAQVETVEAVDCLEALMRVDEVSAFLIGPNDLATAMGHPGQPTHPDVVAAVSDVAERLSAAGKALRFAGPDAAGGRDVEGSAGRSSSTCLWPRSRQWS